MFIVPDRGESGAHQLCPLGHAMSGCCLELLFLGQTFVNTIIFPGVSFDNLNQEYCYETPNTTNLIFDSNINVPVPIYFF